MTKRFTALKWKFPGNYEKAVERNTKFISWRSYGREEEDRKQGGGDINKVTS